MIKYNKINRVFVVFVLLLLSTGCSKKDIGIFNSGRTIFFEKYDDDSGIRIDTASISFSLVGTDVYTHYFQIGLTGELLTEDLKYKIKVVDSLTTAKLGQYELTEDLIFKKDGVVDSLAITIYKDELEEDEEVTLVIELVENENFGLGFESHRLAKFRFSNTIIKPTWWNTTVDLVYFGEYSLYKMETIIAANPTFTTIEGLTLTDIRKTALNTLDYINEHNIMEDGELMIIPMK